MTANPERAEELTQQTFVRAWERLGTFRGESELGGWLRRIAVNIVLADHRSRWRRRRRESESGGLGVLAAGGDGGSTFPPGAALDLDRAIARLPDRARAVFLLHDAEGYGHREIAGLLGIAAGTSKSQLHRARALLREALRS